MDQHGPKGHQDDKTIGSEKQELKSSLWQTILDQLWECYCVQKDDLSDVDEEDESKS